MALSTQRSTSDGTLVLLELSLLYFNRSEISVFIADILTEAGVPSADGVVWNWVGTTDNKISFTPAVPNGIEVLVKRSTAMDAPRHVYGLGAQFIFQTLDDNFTQVLRIAQEAVEGSTLEEVFNNLDMHGYQLKNVGAATDPNDAVSLSQYQADALGASVARVASEAARDTAVAAKVVVEASATAAANSATASSNSATASGNSATASATSASAAAGSASTATTQAGIATTKASEAAASAAAALVSENNAEAAAASIDVPNVVYRTGATGAIPLPSGTTAERPAAGSIWLRYNTTLGQYEAFDGTNWGAVGGGATGAPGNEVFHLNDQIVTASYTIPAGKNAGSFGPIELADGAVVTVPDGAAWTIV